MARRALTDSTIARLKPDTKRKLIPDPGCLGLWVRLMPSGTRSFVAVARSPFGKQVWTTVGSCDHFSVEQARARAGEIIRRIKDGKSAVEPPQPKPDTFEAIAENWFARYVLGEKRLRTADEIRRCLTKYVYPFWRERALVDLKRADVTALLDHVADHHGPRMADVVLATVSSLMHWHASRVDYTPPLSRRMRRVSAKGSSRSRVFDDHELKLVWERAEANGPFGAVIRLLLLTAQRLDKVLTMRWSDFSDVGVWTIHTEAREKPNAGVLALPPVAIEIIRSQPRIEGEEFVFRHTLPRSKKKFADALNLPPWTLHDCRRSAKTLMARAGVLPHISERVLGHVQAGVEGTYDRFGYTEEKRIALEKLAALISEIVHGAPDKVVPIRREAVS